MIMKIAAGDCGSTASYQAVCVALTFEHQHSNQFILESLWTFVPIYELIPSGRSWDIVIAGMEWLDAHTDGRTDNWKTQCLWLQTSLGWRH